MPLVHECRLDWFESGDYCGACALVDANLGKCDVCDRELGADEAGPLCGPCKEYREQEADWDA